MDTETNKVSTASNVKNHKLLFGILSYIGPLVIVSLIVDRNDPFVKFHIKQGLVLLCINIVVSVLFGGRMMWNLWPLYNLINLAILVLSILGIINVVQNKEKELPLVGALAHYFTF